jgi:hypothetical protein
MKVYYLTLCFVILYCPYSYAETKDTPIILLPFSKVEITSVKKLPKQIVAKFPKNKKQYIQFISTNDFATSKKDFLENIKNDELKNKIINTCTSNTVWEAPLDLRDNYTISLTDLKLLDENRKATENNSYKELNDVLFVSFSINYFAEKLGHGETYKFNKEEGVLFSKLKTRLQKLQESKNSIIRLWSLVLSGYTFGLEKKWDSFKKSLNAFNQSPITWNIQFFVNAMLDELKRKKYK